MVGSPKRVIASAFFLRYTLAKLEGFQAVEVELQTEHGDPITLRIEIGGRRPHEQILVQEGFTLP